MKKTLNNKKRDPGEGGSQTPGSGSNHNYYTRKAGHMTRRDNQKKYRTLLTTAAILTAAGIVCIGAAAVETPEEQPEIFEPIPIIEEPIYKEVIKTESESVQDPAAAAGVTGTEAALQYDSVDFVALPVDMTEEDQKIVFDICQEYNIAFPLVMAIIEHESQFDAMARSSTGDSGYMQINDCNISSLYDAGFHDLFLLEDNVGAGVYMLRDLFNRYPGETTFVLMAYNAGEKGAKDMIAAGITETEYSTEIESRAKEFSGYIDAALK